MKSKSVLALGLDPKYADLSAFPDVTADAIRAYVVAEIGKVRELGFDVVDCLVSPDATGEEMLASALDATTFDCVLIGAGLREPETMLPFFERVINRVHKAAPQAAICFNTNPADSTEAVLRWLDRA